MVQEEINKLNEKEDVNEEMDLTADEEESIKKYLAKRKAQGKPADYLKREEERLRKNFARKKAAGDGTIKPGPPSKAEFGRGGKRIKKSSYGQSSPHVSG